MSSLRESRGVRQLANLASFFLPLTLAAGVLSTQHRLADRPIFIWDIMTLILDVGIIALALMKLATSQNIRYFFKDPKRMFRNWISLIFFIPISITTMAAMNLGSFHNIDIGWKILVYGIAGGFGLELFCSPLISRSCAFFRAYICR